LKFDYTDFGHIKIDNVPYDCDVVLNKMKIKPRSKEKSRHLKSTYGHTPLSSEENIPWDCNELVIGTGYHGRLSVTEEFKNLALDKGVTLQIMLTTDACDYLETAPSNTNAVLHITC
jgi:hypothetical protein